MIRLRSWTIAVMAMLACQSSLQIADAEEAPVRIAIEGNFPPFNYLDANGHLQGFDVDMAEALCTAMDVKCTLVIQDWDHMIPGLLADKYDAIVSSMSMSAERREKVAFTQRYYDGPSIFITPKTSEMRVFSPDALAGKRVGVALATSQLAYITDRYPASDIVVFDSSPDLYKGIAGGEVDVIFEDKLAAFDWLSNTKAGQCCEFRGDDIKDATYFGDGAGIALRKEDAALLAKFDAALEKIAQDGTYNMINAKYFPFRIR